MYVIVVGGGKVGYYLAKALIAEGHEVLLVEKDKKRFMQLSDELGEIVFWGDGCEVKTLEEIGTKRCNVVVACTGDDEDNLVISQLARNRFKTPRAIAKINDPEKEEVFEKLGIKTTVSSTKIIFNLIEQEVDVEEIIPLMSLKRGKVEIVEVELKKNSPLVNKQIKDLHLSSDCVFATVIRGEEILFPRGDTILLQGDTLIALTTPEKEKKLKDLLIGKP